MTMTNIDKYTTEHLDSARQQAQRIFRSQQDEPADYSDFLSVVTETLNIGLPFVRAQVNQVLMTPRAPFNSQVLKLIKGLTADTLVNEGGAFHLANEVNRLITLFLPFLTVRDIKVYRNDGQMESSAPFQLVIEFFDRRSNMADKVTYDLRLKDESAPQKKTPTNPDELKAQIADLLLSKGAPADNKLHTLVHNVSENEIRHSEQQPVCDELVRLFREHVPGYRVIEFHVITGPTRSLRVMYENNVTGLPGVVHVEIPPPVERMTTDEALQELSTFGQTYQPETYAKTDGPDFKSDDPFFFKGKLIRDGIPTEDCDTDVETDPVRLRVFLMRKLFEELGEAQASNFTDAKEIGDVIDVMYALGKLNGQHPVEIDELRSRKYLERGGFDGGKVWIDPDKA